MCRGGGGAAAGALAARPVARRGRCWPAVRRRAAGPPVGPHLRLRPDPGGRRGFRYPARRRRRRRVLRGRPTALRGVHRPHRPARAVPPRRTPVNAPAAGIVFGCRGARQTATATACTRGPGRRPGRGSGDRGRASYRSGRASAQQVADRRPRAGMSPPPFFTPPRRSMPRLPPPGTPARSLRRRARSQGAAARWRRRAAPRRRPSRRPGNGGFGGKGSHAEEEQPPRYASANLWRRAGRRHGPCGRSSGTRREVCAGHRRSSALLRTKRWSRCRAPRSPSARAPAVGRSPSVPPPPADGPGAGGAATIATPRIRGGRHEPPRAARTAPPGGWGMPTADGRSTPRQQLVDTYRS